MRIVIHLQKRTERKPCVYDVELNVSPKDPQFVADLGRDYARRLSEKLERELGFERSGKRLRGVPSAIVRYHHREGRFETDVSGMEFAPEFRVALANFFNTMSVPDVKDIGKNIGQEFVFGCDGCAHYGIREGGWRSVWHRGMFGLRGTKLPYCHKRDAFLSYREFVEGCGERTDGPVMAHGSGQTTEGGTMR